ncbi:MAG: substrate-binding domain-containing protein [Enterovibrio sp.]
MATIKDVARLADVSTTTVSHVINETRFVAQETCERVWAAINELNYAPSAVARSLKCNTTRTIGMLVTKSTNPFFAEVVHGVESFCYELGYTLILCNTEGHFNKQRDYLKMLLEKRVDGLLVMCSDLTQELLTTLEKRRDVPMVVMDWGMQHINTDRIEDNAEQGAYLAAQHLIENNHKKIACITGPLSKLSCRQRLEGFKRAMLEAKLTVNPDWILEADFECESAEQATLQLLKEKERPTAIFCFNDIMALAASSTLQKNGLNVPQDMSIVGYDNIDLARFFTPPLTTVEQPKYSLGKKAVALLMERIKKNITAQQIITLQPELVKRGSVAFLDK